MTDGEDKELNAMKTVIESLQSLKPDARVRVLQYVFNRLGISGLREGSVTQAGPLPVAGPSDLPLSQAIVKDVRTLKQERQPKSANQMAALVAYYLSELAPQGERKEAIGTADITKYFKQAGFPLPGRADSTLANARAAGYLDLIGGGLYKLNPVGYNIVVHGLQQEPRKAARKKSARRKSTKKKA